VNKLSGDDIILCQITSQKVKDKYSILLRKNDFVKGGLFLDSNIRPNRIFTADKSIILYKIGNVIEPKIKEVITKIISIIAK
jgi:mRNA interferase MazF